MNGCKKPIHFIKGFKIENEMWTEMKQTNERSYL